MPLTWKAFDSQRDTWRRIKALLSDYDIDFLEKVAEDY
jgi:hypothetical protein